jgi:hypothetical protein
VVFADREYLAILPEGESPTHSANWDVVVYLNGDIRQLRMQLEPLNGRRVIARGDMILDKLCWADAPNKDEVRVCAPASRPVELRRGVIALDE